MRAQSGAESLTYGWLYLRLPLRHGAGIAQLVERNLAKVEVASSSLVSRSRFTFIRRAAGRVAAKAIAESGRQTQV